MATAKNPQGYPPDAAAPQPAAQQPVVIQSQQPVVIQSQQPVIMDRGQRTAPGPVKDEHGEPTLRIYSHSNLLYWWPVWLVGFVMALLSYVEGEQIQVGNALEYYHPSNNLGTIWLVTVFLVILISNVPVRGLASGMVIMGIVLVTVLLAYFDLWQTVLHMLGNLSVHMNLGAYMFISSLLFLVWLLSVFVFDHMSYYAITPGQVTRVHIFGAGQTSYDTYNMVLEKHRSDVFRHWILGLGSGDMKIHTGGTNRQDLHISNVLFVGQKVTALQRLIATKPDVFPEPAVRG